MTPVFVKGDVGELRLVSYSGNTAKNVIVSKVDITLDNSYTVLKTIQFNDIHYVDTGNVKAYLMVPNTWNEGTYCAVWYITAEGKQLQHIEKFSVKDNIWHFSDSIVNYNFSFIPLTYKIYFGAKEFFRVAIKETYDKAYITNNIFYSIVKYKSQFNIEQDSWQTAKMETDGIVSAMIDTSLYSDKKISLFVQFKIVINDGEEIVSQLMPVKVIYPTN